MVIWFAIVLVVMTCQVISRYLLNAPLAWSEEFARYSFVWISYIGCAYCVGVDGHTSITALVDKLPVKGQIGSGQDKKREFLTKMQIPESLKNFQRKLCCAIDKRRLPSYNQANQFDGYRQKRRMSYEEDPLHRSGADFLSGHGDRRQRSHL